VNQHVHQHLHSVRASALVFALPLSRHSERSEESAFYDRNARSIAKKSQETDRLSSPRGFGR
jgi:hypothetical protein